MMRRRDTPKRWTAADVPDQRGRTVVITGANTGLGFEAAKVLAERGATVVLACRDQDRAAAAAARISAAQPVTALPLDLASLASIRQAAERLRARHPRVDLLINNAGVATPDLRRTEDGFELHIGVNHLGHFAFTGLVLDQLLAVPGSRIVTVSSAGHRNVELDLDNLNWERGYRMGAAYGRSKLANLLFTYELQRRLAAAGASTVAVAAHPGVAQTEVGRHMPAWMQAVVSPRLKILNSWFTQDARMGALGTLRAAADPAVRGGEYYGPGGRHELTGFPVRRESSEGSHDADLQRRLWQESERLTGVSYRFASASRTA